MKKFGTGSAQVIWGWWDKFWKDTYAVGNTANVGQQFVGIFVFIGALAATIVVGIADAVVEVVSAIADLFNGKEDDQARDKINSSSCQQLNTLSDNQMVDMINAMLDGPTGDDDENAILKLLRCLSCERLNVIAHRVGIGNLQSNIDGSEFDELQVILGSCGVINFSAWDDDATRLFVNRLNCPQINALSVNSLHQLFRNLIEGSCGDDDERAINKIMNCTSCEKIRAIMNINGTRWDDFDSAIQGSEWDDFERILSSRCGIRG